MAKELRGTRYLTVANEALARFIVEDLHYLDYPQTMRWYSRIVPRLDNRGRALLGCNDRYFLLTGLLHRTDALHGWVFARCREIEDEPYGYLDLWARYHFKAVRLDETVPTPDGWRRHGDLRPGDRVFGPDGTPARVLRRTPVFHDADCYRVTFDKGYSVVVSGDHLWTVDINSRARRAEGGRDRRRRVTIDTRELMAAVQRATATSSAVLPSVPVCQPLQFPWADLPIPPYALGAWLGDGTSSNASITSGLDDADEMQALLVASGIAVGRAGHSNAVSLRLGNGSRLARSPVQPALRKLGILGNKHIPEVYAKAAPSQRWELLRGLMDTDGCCDTRGTATFCNANEVLARDVFRLAAGLGLKPSLRQHIGAFKGRPYPFWQVSFQARGDAEPVFGLARKRARATVAPAGRSTRHAIVSVEPVPSEPCSCIEVDRPDGLYLLGEHCIPTHNSTLGTFAGVIQEVLCDPEITVAIMSATNDIARPFLMQIQEEFERNEDLKAVYPDVLWENPRKEAPRWSRDAGIVVRRKGNPKEATIEAFGLIDGMRTGKHYSLLVYDDLVTEKLVGNPEMIRKVTERWELSDNLGQLTGTKKLHFGTRYSFADSYGVILERKALKERVYPATVDGTLNSDPVLMTKERWNEVKATQRATVAAQMLLNPVQGNEALFRSTWFKTYDVRPTILNVYIMVDPSRGRGQRSDRTAIAVIGVDVAGNKYLLDGVRHRMPLSERWMHLKNLYVKWRDAIGVQAVQVGYERYGAQTEDEVILEYMQRDGVSFQLIELNWAREGKQSKPDRISRLEPDMRAGRFYMPELVWHPDLGGTGPHAGVALWSVDEDGKIAYRPQQGPTRAQRAAFATGQPYRVVSAIKRLDEDKNVYDVTRAFIEEALFAPFSPKDDLIDVVSRIYDMDPRPAVQYEAAALEPVAHPDA